LQSGTKKELLNIMGIYGKLVQARTMSEHWAAPKTWQSFAFFRELAGTS
jgi:hypothetical protein